MPAYFVLAAAAGCAFFGLGLFSIGLLLVARALAGDAGSNLDPTHRQYVRRSANIGILAHLLLIAILGVKIWYVIAQNGEGWWQTMLAHWFIDHLIEAAISLYLGIRAFLGILRVTDQVDASGNPLKPKPPAVSEQ
jgi:hypothetical protein